MKLVRWILVLAILGGGAYVAVAVPIGGKTLLERVRGSGPGPDAPSAVDRPDEAPRPVDGAPAPKADPVPPRVDGTPGTDVHTEEDRQKLDALIESKLGEGQGAPAGGAPDRRP